MLLSILLTQGPSPLLPSLTLSPLSQAATVFALLAPHSLTAVARSQTSLVATPASQAALVGVTGSRPTLTATPLARTTLTAVPN